jgi:hypothetical protein
MKKIITFISLVGSSMLYAQIPNSGMETWGTAGFFEPEGPLSYVSANVFASPLVSTLNPVSVSKGTGADAYSGSFSAKITTVKLVSNPASGSIPDTVGILLLGSVSLASSPPLKSGTSWTERLTSINFHYKYSPVGNDNGAMMAYLTKWNGISRDTIATAAYPITSAASSFTLANGPFVYNNSFPSNATPDSLHVYFLSSARPWLNSSLVPNPAKIGSALWIDEAAAIGLNEKYDLMTKVSVYPNPANEFIHFKSENTNAKTVEIVDLNGKLVASEEFKDKALMFSTDNLTNGLFIYLIKDKNKALISEGKVEVCK